MLTFNQDINFFKMRKYILILSAVIGLTSCKKDFLDVRSDSKYEGDYVFGNKVETDRALNAVYQSLLSNDNYGSAYFSTFALNSDVEFTAFSSELPNVNGEDFRAFDGASHSSNIAKFWNKQYQGIERANLVIDGIQNSEIFNTGDKDLTQMLGEARVLRAMYYHDLVVMFGDVPFNTEPSMKLKSLVIPIKNRNEILTFLINDLKEAATGMKFAREMSSSGGVERASREFCYGMIARMALTRGGYALYPDGGRGKMERQPDYKDYYRIAMDYADSAIMKGNHNLTLKYRDIFINEVNNVVVNNEDPIFEIPFLRLSSGNVGNVTGGKVDGVESITKHDWGTVNGSMRLNAFYHYSFDTTDVRMEYTVGHWGYDVSSVPQVLVDYSMYNNKWSKLWADPSNALGNSSSDKTGINFPYMRYADILLMFAEAVNEVEGGLNGPHGARAKQYFKNIRSRAFQNVPNNSKKIDFYTDSVTANKDKFFNALTLERKWEFGGENIRWKDLVRWNLYSKVIVDSFMEYYIVAAIGGSDFMEGSDKYAKLPINKFYKREPNPNNKDIYPNTTLPIIRFRNKWEAIPSPGSGWLATTLYEWYDTNTSMPKNQIFYSFRGYIKGGPAANWIDLRKLDQKDLPPVRYILPIPASAIQLSNGAYKNQYGYN